jgi:hypothetical protein
MHKIPYMYEDRRSLEKIHDLQNLVSWAGLELFDEKLWGLRIYNEGSVFI